MVSKSMKFKIPEMKERINAIGPLTNIDKELFISLNNAESLYAPMCLPSYLKRARRMVVGSS